MKDNAMIGTLEINGKKMVVLEQEEYDDLRNRASAAAVVDESELPQFPPQDEHGHRDAIEFARISIARTLIIDRRKAGLTQQALANLAGMKQETIARLESGKHTATQRTIERIEKALAKAKGMTPR